jgi:hypothetical protein
MEKKMIQTMIQLMYLMMENNMKRLKQIIIGNLLLCSMIGGISAQKIELKGLVREVKNNEAMAFVNVVLQTPDSVFVTGTMSGDDGKFVLPNLNPGDYRLTFSYIGYATQYIALEGLKANIAIPDVLMEEDAAELDAVTVTASAVTSRIDRKLIFPTERQVNASNNGVDLLQNMMLPRLQIDPLTHAVGALGGGEVQLRINGVKMETGDIMALQPQDVIRIEYHDNPGLRYGNAAAVINYIVRRHETGGNLGVNIQNTFNLKQFGNNSINGRINHKKSEFAINYSLNQRDIYQMWRDNEETFHFADGSTLQRREVGEPGHLQRNWHDLNATYSYLNEQRMFNVAFRYYAENQPHNDYNGKLYNMANPDDYVQMFDREKNLTSRPALDLYYQENLKNDQTLVVNVVGTNNSTDNNRIYTESRDGIYLTDVNNSVAGNKYSWIGEGIYEKKLGNNGLSAGLHHAYSYADNTYQNGHEYHTEMQQSETFLYAEWKGKVKKLDYTLGAGVTRSSFRQVNDGMDYNTYTFNPRIGLFHPLPGNSSIRLTARINNNMPSLSELSVVEQIIDSIQILRGNPNLKPYLRYESNLNYEWQKGLFYLNWEGQYEYLPSAIMDEKFREGNKIVQTWNNQKNWQRLYTGVLLRVGPIKDFLVVMLHGSVNHFISNGNNYRHVYTNPSGYVVVSGNYKKFQTQFIWQITPSNRFYGETLSGGERAHILSMGYNYKNMNFGLGAYNPFVNNYRHDTENRSEYASYKKRMYVNEMSQMFFFTFSCNFNFGRTFQSGQKRVNNVDEDAGIIKVGK